MLLILFNEKKIFKNYFEFLKWGTFPGEQWVNILYVKQSGTKPKLIMVTNSDDPLCMGYQNYLPTLVFSFNTW